MDDRQRTMDAELKNNLKELLTKHGYRVVVNALAEQASVDDLPTIATYLGKCFAGGRR